MKCHVRYDSWHVGLTEYLSEYLSEAVFNKNNAENRNENDKNISDSDSDNGKTIRDNTVKHSQSSNNVFHVSQLSQLAKSSTDRYQPEEINSETMCPNVFQSPIPYSDCDLKNQEGANRFTAEVERLGKSKLADMAAANLPGNGVMEGRE